MKYFAGFITLLVGLVYSFSAQAVCPVCTIAAAAGLGFARWLGIDDTITGIWIGGLLMSVTGWTINWLNGKKWTFPYLEISTFIFWYGITILPLWFAGIIGGEFNKLWNLDKALIGISVGTIAFLIGMHIDSYLRKFSENGKALFPFQKVVAPLVMLLISTLVFYFITK